MKILISPEEFVKSYGDFVLIYALDAARFNFLEVVRKLRIKEEAELYFGRTLDKYTTLDQFEIIIRDIISGTPADKYEELLIKMHNSFMFPDHLVLVNPTKPDAELLDSLREIVSEKLLCNTSYWPVEPGMPDTFKQISVAVDDFTDGKEGLFCFVLLHKDDYSCLGHGDVEKVFKEARPLYS